MCNKSLSTGISPALLKYLVTKSLFKKGHKHAVSNYRPKSLLTFFSKNFQKLIFARLTQHFSDNNILIEEQFRFGQNSSLEKAVFKLQNEILNASNNKFIFRGTFCDLEKAFDCVNHDSILSKLEFYGITRPAYALMNS
jgi:hypothetical protein